MACLRIVPPGKDRRPHESALFFFRRPKSVATDEGGAVPRSLSRCQFWRKLISGVAGCGCALGHRTTHGSREGGVSVHSSKPDSARPTCMQLALRDGPERRASSQAAHRRRANVAVYDQQNSTFVWPMPAKRPVTDRRPVVPSTVLRAPATQGCVGGGGGCSVDGTRWALWRRRPVLIAASEGGSAASSGRAPRGA